MTVPGTTWSWSCGGALAATPLPPSSSSPSTMAATRYRETEARGGIHSDDPQVPPWHPLWHPKAPTGVPVPLQVVGDVPGELQGLRLRTLSLGGLLGDSGTVEEGFQGCLQVWRHGHRGCGEHGVVGVGLGGGRGDVEEDM